MATVQDVHDGLEGVLAFASEIAEPDRDGGALRYRLDQIRTLTGLDLSKHSGRVRAALALQLLEVTRSVG